MIRAAGVLVVILFSMAALADGETPVVSITTPDVERVVGPPRGERLAGEALEEKTHQVSAQLRCPVCQGLSVNDSPAPMAINMKNQVRDLLARGYDQQQIVDYFESSYGEFVRLSPALRGVNWLVWIAPLIALLVGGGVVWIAIGRMRAKPSEQLSSEGIEAAGIDRDRLPDDDALIPYVLRVRELAYGWPGGRMPSSPDASGEEPR
ncbi:MAG TPA: cytochrome c-type biogenesis protein CcmH [Thermoanaerobaculia bacterium]|nr:cytochrome c-type biogenesis protein CcmH [Thermoanaerobaculia bacterium]